MTNLNLHSRKAQQKGFTLIELLIVIAIIGILAAIATPSYLQYVKRAKFAEVVNAVNPVKTAIEVCFAVNQSLASCDTEAEIGQVLDEAAEATYVTSVAITGTTAVITATGTSDVDSKTYILIPSDSGEGLNWAGSSGTCVAAGLCN